jgi:FkbM family methyltransferase
MSYSQLEQDLNVIKFYNGKKDGFFIEIGANDGISLSNTYLLEKEYNWKGICCEPNPFVFQNLIVNRSKSICCPEAVYNSSDNYIIFKLKNNSLLSGISNHIIETKKFIFNQKTKNKLVQVKTISLLDLLNKYNCPSFIEYISIDTEGSELEIIRNFDFNKYTFGLIDIEHNYIEPKRTEIRNLLLSNGYIYIGENSWDDMYKHNSV